jgi:hypothetical protein
VADQGQGQGRAAPPPRKGGKQVLGMPRGVVIAAGAALLLGVGFMWWRSRKSAAAAASTAGTAGTANAPGPCYDAAGSVVDCSDPSAVTGPNASTFQTEIQDLQGQLAANQTADTATATGLSAQQGAAAEQETDLGELAAEDARLAAAAGKPPAWTLAQERRAWAPGRAAGERGKIFYKGKWYSVPRPPAPKPGPRPAPRPAPRHTAPMQRAHAHRPVA